MAGTIQVLQDVNAPSATEINLKSGPIPGLKIFFSDNTGFVTNVRQISANAPPTRNLAHPSFATQTRSWSARVKSKTQSIRLQEQYGDDLQLAIEVPIQKLILDKCSSIDENHDETDTFVIQFHLADPNDRFVLIKEGNKKKQYYFADEVKSTTVMGMLDPQLREYIQLCRCAKIVIPDYKSINLPVLFSPTLVKDVLAAKFAPGSANNPDAYCKTQKDAIHGESEIADAARVKLARKDAVKAQFHQLPGYTNRFCVHLQTIDGSAWAIQPQSRLTFASSKDNQISQAGPFTELPGSVPNQPSNKPNVWQGTAFISQKELYCTIDNFLSQNLFNRLQGVVGGPWFTDLDIALLEDADESITERQILAVDVLQKVMNYELNIGQTMPDPDIRLNYRLKMSQVFLPGIPLAQINHHIQLKSSALDWSQVFQMPKLQLSEPSHQAAFRTCFQGPVGLALVQGPPATGKTTTVAKMVAVLDRSCELYGENVVVAAHTNEAVRVACTRTMDIYEQVYDTTQPWQYICLIITPAVANFWKITGKTLDPRLAQATIDAHLDRLAADPAVQGAVIEFRTGQQEMKRYGRISSQIANKYQKQRTMLIEKLKGRVNVWFCTLSTCHLKNEVFTIRDGRSGLRARVLIVDEASQATDVYVAMAMLSCNPYQTIFAGDHKQLEPHNQSEEARFAWQKSLFQKHMDRRSPSTMLQVQYRTTSMIYAGTNAHYDGRVNSHPSTSGRPMFNTITTAFRRIRFVDANNRNFQLQSTVQLFDMTNSEVNVDKETGTSQNYNEARFVLGLAGALSQAGVAPSNIMALSGYQGQYDLMNRHEFRLPQRGLQIRKIDSSQGDEAQIVVFSMVKTLKSGIGFMSNAQRQNVGTSRAREAFIWVGDFEVIQQSRRATAWQVWYNALIVRNPGCLVKIKAPVTWYVDNQELILPGKQPKFQHGEVLTTFHEAKSQSGTQTGQGLQRAPSAASLAGSGGRRSYGPSPTGFQGMSIASPRASGPTSPATAVQGVHQSQPTFTSRRSRGSVSSIHMGSTPPAPQGPHVRTSSITGPLPHRTSITQGSATPQVGYQGALFPKSTSTTTGGVAQSGPPQTTTKSSSQQGPTKEQLKESFDKALAQFGKLTDKTTYKKNADVYRERLWNALKKEGPSAIQRLTSKDSEMVRELPSNILAALIELIRARYKYDRMCGSIPNMGEI